MAEADSDEEEAAEAEADEAEAELEATIEVENDLRSEIVTYALQFVGNRYKYGGTNPNTGVDCSGFTSDVESNMVDPLSRSVADNIARAHLGAAYLAAHTRLSAGRMRKFNFCCVTHYIGG